MTVKTGQPISGIAVIGMACRFPGATCVEEFWRNLCDGVESIRPLSDEEMLAAGLEPEELENPRHVAAAALLGDIDRFDAAFFGINAREAEVMDPQHRVFLECAWEALEDAGYDAERYEGAIGVFGGGVHGGYASQNLMPAGVFDDKSSVLQTILSNEKDYLTTRVSYKLNLRGPSYNVQSGCSTSLVAVHLACQNLLNYESDMALAGGIAIDVGRNQGYYHHEGSVSSPDGHCRAFDAKAAGTVFGNGVGIVVLKRLEDALADGDTIHAVILGSATNNDGSHKVGFTAPSVSGQSKVIVEALADAGVSADTVGYVEAHGTGTTLGDPIEVEAMTRAFGASTTKRQFCAIGSVKTNVGHLDGAAGISGFIKAVLSLRHGLLPPSLHFEEPNPKIQFDETPFFVNDKLTTWTAGTQPGAPRRAGVSSFGMGGTNVHVVLQEAPAAAPARESRPSELLVLSARSATALEAATRNLADFLQARPEWNLGDVAHTLQMGRAAFSHRLAVVCADTAHAAGVLSQSGAQAHVYRGESRPVVFLFTGQGAQYVGMGRALYETEPVFRSHVDRCCTLLQSHLGLDLRKVLYPPPSNPAEARAAADNLARTEYAQPALFVTEYALAQLWMEWGVQPAACIGHSLGEYVAACLAGVFSLEDALKIVAARGRLMQQLPAGAMTAVTLSAADATPLLDGDVAIAAANAPKLTVVSGPIGAIERFEARCAGRAEFRRLQTSHAFHSPMMEPIVQEFTELMASVELAPPSLQYVSNLTGKWIDADRATSPEYWATHLRRAVRFGDGIRFLLDQGAWHFIEVGPGRTLASLVKQAGAGGRDAGDELVLTSLPHAVDGGGRGGDNAQMLGALGRLWQHGVAVNWTALRGPEPRRRVPLPTYPFERERYWVEPTDEQKGKKPEEPPPPDPLAKQADIANWFYLPEWRQTPPALYYAQGQTVDSSAGWLVFAAGDRLGAEVIDRLASYAGRDRVVTVYAGGEFARRDARTYAIDPERPEDYVRLLGELDASGRYPDVVAHLWNVADDRARATPATVEDAQSRGFFSLVWLAQAMVACGREGQARPVSVKVVTSDLFDITGAEPLRPEKATLLAACRVIPQEHPEIRCSTVDVTSVDATTAGRITDELVALAPEPCVAYRGGRRWSPLVEPLVLGQAEPQRVPLRDQGVYLVIGGLGAIGAAIARHLARTRRARLVLVNRSPLPERSEWDNWLASHDARDAVSARIRVARSIEEAGGEVLVAAADVADRDQMAAVVEQASVRFGRLDGVIHAAGIAGAGTIQLKKREGEGSVLAAVEDITRKGCEAQFRPKMRGLFVLEDVLGDRPLDFCLVVSSLSTVMGGPGYAVYAAANTFMDAFVARHNRQSAMRWMSANWDAWSFSPGGAAQSAVSRVTLSEEEGLDVFERLLSVAALGHVVVSTINLYARLSPPRPEPEAEPEASPAESGGRTLYRRPASLESMYEAPQTALERTVAGIWQEVLGMDRVGRSDSFFELGGHSLLAVQVAARLEDVLQVEVPMRNVFDSATLADLAARIQGVLMAAHGEEVLVGGDGGDTETEDVEI